MIENSLWVEKYRPKNLDEYVGNDDIKKKVQVWLEQGDIPNLLFFGPAGTGKCLDYSELIDVEINLTDEEIKQLNQYIHDE